jgi:hypothetical protein
MRERFSRTERRLLNEIAQVQPYEPSKKSSRAQRAAAAERALRLAIARNFIAKLFAWCAHPADIVTRKARRHGPGKRSLGRTDLRL